MANRKARVSQSEITRALKAAKSAGYTVARFEVLDEGVLRIYLAGESDATAVNEWDLALGVA